MEGNKIITLTLSEDEASAIELALRVAAIQFDENADDFLAGILRAFCTKILDQRREQEEQEG